MAYKKIKKTVAEEFNMDDWLPAKPLRAGMRKSFDENQIKVSVKSHPKKKDFYYVTFGFRKKLFSALDKSLASKIIVMKHKQDSCRFMLTKSDNGYKVNPAKTADYFYLKSLMYVPAGLSLDVYALDPVLHPKSPNNSGAILELKIPQATI